MVIDSAPGALRRVGVLFKAHFPRGCAAQVIADEHSWAAAGEALEEALRAAGVSCRRHILPGIPRLKPCRHLGEAIADIKTEATSADERPILIALGSGVINDLVKFAAHRRGDPFLCAATAASMDGYASPGAPLVDDGFKRSFPCHAAQVIVADPDVLANAPGKMAGWGFADLAGKVPAGADWMLADALQVELIHAEALSMVQRGLGDWLRLAPAVGAGDPQALRTLFDRLVNVGLAMGLAGSSRPASGADHQIAHVWEMEGLSLPSGEPASHGACVGVGAVIVLTLYEHLLAHDLRDINIKTLLAAAPSPEAQAQQIHELLPDPAIARHALRETAAKTAGEKELRLRLERLIKVWPELSAALSRQLMPPGQLAELLHAAGAPAWPAEIGVEDAELPRVVRAARFIRSRYTVLDLLAEADLLDGALEELVAAR